MHTPDQSVLKSNLITLVCVYRVQFNWESRNKDFERWRRPPPVLGPPLPLTIHLAGESSTRELQERLDLEQTEWNNKLVVSNPRFQPYRCVICVYWHYGCFDGHY